MLQRLRNHASFANITALLALFIALSGSAYAVKIGTKQLKNKSISEKKLKAKAVTEKKIKDSAVTAAKIATGAVTQGKLGPITVFSRLGDAAADGANSDANIACPAGTRAIGGGARADDNATDPVWLSSRPAISEAQTGPPASGGTFTAWRARAHNPAGGTASINAEAYVICIG